MVMVGTPLEGEHLHPYTLGAVSEDKCHGKEQIYTRAKDSDVLESIRTGISTTELCRKHNIHPQTFHNRSRDSWSLVRQSPVSARDTGTWQPGLPHS